MFGKLLRPIRWLTDQLLEPINDDTNESEMDDAQETPVVKEPNEPTVLDVIVVKEMLQKALKLPPEIVDSIVDLAEYWPHTTTEIDYSRRPRLMRKDARGRHPSENTFLVSSCPSLFPSHNTPKLTHSS